MDERFGAQRVDRYALHQKEGKIPVVRPFLKIPRKRLETYARSQHLRWVEDDSSNTDESYLRNFYGSMSSRSLSAQGQALNLPPAAALKFWQKPLKFLMRLMRKRFRSV